MFDFLQNLLEDLGLITRTPKKKYKNSQHTFRVKGRRDINIPSPPGPSFQPNSLSQTLPTSVKVERKQKLCPYCKHPIYKDPYNAGWAKCNCGTMYHYKCWKDRISKSGCLRCQGKQALKVA